MTNNRLEQSKIKPGETKEIDVEAEEGRNSQGAFQSAPYKIVEKLEEEPKPQAEETKAGPPGIPGGAPATYGYPMGVGPMMMSGCYGQSWPNSDPCKKARIPLATCRYEFQS